ncbi:MAG TPA: flagellar type III secretion system pore protein FliP [Thermoanaerobacterales bacterium]|nr:flagellar type III secretion system pore protein FliP [Thermoanaerobacterales bacterium]
MKLGKKRMINKDILFIVLLIFFVFSIPQNAHAKAIPLPNLNIDIGTSEDPEDVVSSIQILLLLTILALAPAILITMTSFTRIAVVLSFMRNALATQQTPPNQVLISLALFLTLFIMLPVFTQINEQSVQPYLAGDISQEDALKNALAPLRSFMLRQTREKDLALFINYADIDVIESYDDIPTSVIIPSFIISELKTAFQIGFVLFIPFLVIDMIVACTLMAMGMLMLPPVMISLPFKLLLFIMVDGWNLLANSIILSFK